MSGRSGNAVTAMASAIGEFRAKVAKQKPTQAGRSNLAIRATASPSNRFGHIEGPQGRRKQQDQIQPVDQQPAL